LHQCVPCPPVVCVVAKSSGRGAAVDVGGRIVTGIVGNVGSRSDGGGGDVNTDT
jgi:hypothetical protein